MKIKVLIAVVILFPILFMCFFTVPSSVKAVSCTEEWFRDIDTHYVQVDDGDGHGPDCGDGEWFSVVEARLHLVPVLNSDHTKRCEAIQNELTHHRYIRFRPTSQLIRIN